MFAFIPGEFKRKEEIKCLRKPLMLKYIVIIFVNRNALENPSTYIFHNNIIFLQIPFTRKN